MRPKKPKVFLVIPTIRSLKFLEAWGNQFKKCHLIIVEDHQKKKVDTPSKKSYSSVHHFTWQDIKEDLGKNEWIIARKNAGIRSYGFYKAHQLGADIIITIDDDCFPTNKNFIQTHLDNLKFKPASGWFASYPDPKWMHTRGFPYRIRNKLKTVISHGLWSGALDLDAKTETKLSKLLNEKPYPPIRQIIPFDYFYPMCSMNLSFKSKITPIMFFPMMGSDPSGKSWGFDRFDDIWAGIFSKKILDHLGFTVVNGSPSVNHRKASKPGQNLIKEKPGLKVNEILWQKVKAVKLTKKTPKACYIELAQKTNFPKTKYFKKLTEAMIIWANLF